MVRGERLKGEGGGDTEEDEVGRREDRLPSTRTACRVDAVGQHRKAEAVPRGNRNSGDILGKSWRAHLRPCSFVSTGARYRMLIMEALIEVGILSTWSF